MRACPTSTVPARTGLRRSVTQLTVITAALLLFGVEAGAAAGNAGDLIQPHRAVYDAKLLRTTSNSEVIGVEGRMAFEWRDDCEGWGVDQIFLLSFSYASGAGIDIRSSYNTWEAKDGSRYTAKVDRDRAGTKEAFSVVAGDGEARFRGDQEQVYQLPVGTMFPTEHTIALLDQAQDGSRFLSVNVFDGSEVEPANLISSVVGNPRTEPAAIEHTAIEDTYWPMQLAFFKPGQQESVPDFEMRIDLQQNGIARELLIDYGDFVVGMTLRDLELLEGKGC